MRQSVKIVSQCLDMLPRGPVQLGTLRAPYTLAPPPGSAYVGQENPRGEYGTYIVSDGTRYPYRLKFRDPCFVNLQIFPKVLRGVKIADAIAISGSFDMVLGGIDR
jgi:NADH:ubiquinone oxidoreductase subunit D